MLPFFLLLFLFQCSNCCLIINRPITTTTTPQCDCPYLLHDKTSMDFFSPIYPFYQTNMTHYPISEPKFSQNDCEATMYCENGKTLFLLNLGDIYVYDQREVTGICDPFSKNWSIDDGVNEMITKSTFEGVCVDYTQKYIDLKNCKCPPISFIDQAGIKRLPFANGGFLGNLKTVEPEIEFGDDCSFSYSCKALNGSYHNLVLFQEDKPPIYLSRSEILSEQLLSPKSLTCIDGVWKYSGARLSKLHIACQDYSDNCNHCPSFVNSSALGFAPNRLNLVENAQLEQQNLCSWWFAVCPDAYQGIISSNNPTFLLGKLPSSSIISSIFCYPEESGSYNWYYNNVKLENIAISCRPANGDTCYCAPITLINDTNRAIYDKKEVLPAKLAQVFVQSNKPGTTTCDITTVTCYNGVKPYLFAANWESPVRLNEPLFCANELSGGSGGFMWMTSTYGQITNPTVACPDDSTTSCGCPPVTSRSPQRLYEQSPNPMCQKVITCDNDFFIFTIFRIYTTVWDWEIGYRTNLRDGEPLVMTCDPATKKWEVNNQLFEVQAITCSSPPPPPPTH